MLLRLVCLFRRQHDYALREGHGRVFLRCRRCGVRTPGWETSPTLRVVEPVPARQGSLDDPAAAVSPSNEPIERPGALSPLRLLLDDPVPDLVRPDPRGEPLRLLLADSERVLPLGDLEFDQAAPVPVTQSVLPIGEPRLLLDQQ